MSPSTETPQDAMRIKGVWTCHSCHPSRHGKGGQAAFYAHWLSFHYVPPVEP